MGTRNNRYRRRRRYKQLTNFLLRVRDKFICLLVVLTIGMSMYHAREVYTIAEFDGVSIQEAVLSYAERKKMTKTAFCGPDKSYPAHDAKHVRAGFQRLSQHGKKYPKAVTLRIYNCLKKKAKKFKVEHDPTKFAWLTGKKKKIEETVARIEANDKKLREWMLKERGI